MFDLEAAVAAWRQQMRNVSGEALDELEAHLREAVDDHARAGLSAERAFDAAVTAMGQTGVLKEEFAKVSPESALKQALLSLAGIPELSTTTTMNTASYTEPRWATYLKGAAFLVPAILLWTLTAIFVVPKLQQICAMAGLPDSDISFWGFAHSGIRTTLFFTEHGLLIGLGVATLLFLLEWRSRSWPRYRRAAVGVTAFILNTVVLLSLFVMIVAALLAAPALATR
jgi:hypothetical protein